MVGDRPQGRRALIDQVTVSGGGNGEGILDDGMEVVELSARYKIKKALGKEGIGAQMV